MRTTENTAIFGSIEFDFTDSLTGTIEVRHATDKIESDYRVSPSHRRDV
ncbi:MAG: hypothetical protein CM15mP74_29740 [Halieaceae bacterium]|nr:MAG: hypothetical protein CM15mP74_29740 [Halieaceae bacterium]